MKSLKTLDLSNNPIKLDEMAGIIDYCKENRIELLLPLDKKKQDYETILSVNQEDPIVNLSLSGLSIDAVSEDMMQKLSSVVSVIFRQSLASPFQTLEIMKTLLKLPKAVYFDFSANTLSSKSIDSLVEGAKQHAPRAIVIRDLSTAESNLISVLERIEEEMNFNATIPNSFRNMQDLWGQIKPSVEEQKEVLEAMEILDLSELAIETLPSEFVAYFSNVEGLSLSKSYPENGKSGSSFSCLLFLPKLEELDLSSNYITSAMFANLSVLVGKPEKSLNSVNLFGSKYKKEDFDAFTLLCGKNGVNLTYVDTLGDKRKRESSSEEDEEEAVIFAKRAKIES
jgi:hypothetical protein